LATGYCDDFIWAILLKHFPICFDYAFRKGHTNLVRLLLDHGAVYRLANGEVSLFNEALFCAAIDCGHSKLVRLMLDRGVDPSIEDDKAIAAASRNGDFAVVKILLSDTRLVEEVLHTGLQHSVNTQKLLICYLKTTVYARINVMISLLRRLDKRKCLSS
jgi:hypothetical protein